MANWLVQHFILVMALAIGVALISRIAKLRPAIRHVLWLLVLIKLLVPPVVAWPWSFSQVIGIVEYRQSAPGDAPAARDASAPALQDSIPFLRLVGNQSPATPELRARDYRHAAGLALLGVWALGGLAMAAVQGLRYVRLRRAVRASAQAPEWLAASAEELASRFGVKAPAVLVSSDVGSALLLHVSRPKIVVPESLIASIPQEAWPPILAHELAHLKRRDLWTGWIELLAGCVWWWNPVFWYARKRLHEAAEMACDAWVVWALPEQRRDYAEILVRVVELAATSHAAAPALGMGSGPAVAFERRLVMILRQQVPCRVPALASVILFAFALAVLPGWSQDAVPAPAPDKAPTSSSSPAAAQEKPEIEKVLESPISIEFENIHVSEITAFIGDSYDVNIVVDQRAVAAPPKHTPPMPSPKPGETPAPTAPSEASEAPALPGPDCVTDGMVPHIDLSNVPMREGLKALVRPVNLAVEVDPHCIWLSSPALIEADAKYPKPSMEGASEDLAKVLKSPVSIEFENIHVQEILEFISDSWTVNLQLDSRVVRPQKAASDRPLGSPGYVTDGMVQYINLKNMPLAEALEVVLRSLNLTFRADEDIVWISSHELIDAPPLPAAKVNKQAPDYVPNITVGRILDTDAGCLAWIDRDGQAAWHKQGDSCPPYTVEAIDPKGGLVRFHRDKLNESMSKKAESGVIALAQVASAADVEPDVAALRIRQVHDRPRVQIRTPGGGERWYDEGMAFEYFRVLRIDSATNTVLMYSDKKNAPFLLNVEETSQPPKP